MPHLLAFCPAALPMAPTYANELTAFAFRNLTESVEAIEGYGKTALDADALRDPSAVHSYLWDSGASAECIGP